MWRDKSTAGRSATEAQTPILPDYAAVIDWLVANMPSRETAMAVVHNDYRFDNLVLDVAEPTRDRRARLGARDDW